LQFVDRLDNNSYRFLQPFHRSDIISLALLPPKFLASATNGGDVMIWSMRTNFPIYQFNTGRPNSKSRVNFDIKPRDPEAASDQPHEYVDYDSVSYITKCLVTVTFSTEFAYF